MQATYVRAASCRCQIVKGIEGDVEDIKDISIGICLSPFIWRCLTTPALRATPPKRGIYSLSMFLHVEKQCCDTSNSPFPSTGGVARSAGVVGRGARRAGWSDGVVAPLNYLAVSILPPNAKRAAGYPVSRIPR